MELLERFGKATDTGAVKLSLGLLAYQQGDLDGAERWLTQVVACKDETYEVRARSTLGLLHLERHDLLEAQDCFEKGMNIARQVGREDVTAYCDYGLARVSEERGDYQQALRRAAVAADTLGRLGLEKRGREAQALVARLEKELHTR